jgi:hypothetical protein
VFRSPAAALVFLVTAGGAAAQTPRYAAGQLACARFVERADADIQGEAGGRTLTETGGRYGRWIVRGVPVGDSGVRIEAWFDSLTIWRRSGDATRSADTDGIIGGRYRGTLSAGGAYTASATPFVPDQVAEFADLRDAFADLLPPLPPTLLPAGAVWRDGSGTTIERLGDSAGADGPIQRYRLERQSSRRDVSLDGSDTLRIPVKQTTVEAGEFAWEPTRGLVSRTRTITVQTEVPAGGAVRVPVRSRVVQRVTLVRVPDDASACRESR